MSAPPLRVFVSTGEASGEVLAADLLEAMRAHGAVLEVDGIGGERLAGAGVNLVRSTAGWASLGHLAALTRVPRLWATLWATALRLRGPQQSRARYDLIVLVDFGAFHVRLARTARLIGVTAPILYYVPPGAWLDDVRRARLVVGAADPLTPFRHQRDFYRAHGLPIAWHGHPLASTIAPRTPLPPAPDDGGVVALLPGSRSGELVRHGPLVLDALALLAARRPRLTALIAAADDAAAAAIAALLAERPPLPVTVVRSARAALAQADAAAIASGTAVLEAALLAVPLVTFYILAAAQYRIARRIYRGRFIALPNLVLDEPLVPELVQDRATPAALAAAIEAQLRAPDEQLAGFVRLRAELGPADALARCAQTALELAERW